MIFFRCVLHIIKFPTQSLLVSCTRNNYSTAISHVSRLPTEMIDQDQTTIARVHHRVEGLSPSSHPKNYTVAQARIQHGNTTVSAHCPPPPYPTVSSLAVLVPALLLPGVIPPLRAVNVDLRAP